MKIGIDLDEVTINFMDSLNKFYHKKTGKLYKKEHYKSYNWWELWGCTREEAIAVEHEFVTSKNYEEMEPIENAIESINKLVDKNELFIITSRPEKNKEKTLKWINKHLNRIKAEIIFSGDFHGGAKTKVEICKDLQIDIILEDNKDYALACAGAGIKVILFDKPWNQKVMHKNITRVKSWEEAIKDISM